MIYKKIIKSLVVLLAFFYMACGDPIPVKEMAAAKMGITSAKKVNSEKYALEKYKEASDYLLLSHDNVKDDKLEDAKKNAEKALAAANEAYELSVPLLAKDTIEIAEKSLKLADEAAAGNLAIEEFEVATGKFENSQKLFEEKTYYDSYLEAIEADKAAKNARNIAISKSSFLKDIIDEVDKTIIEAKKYNAEELFPEKLKLAVENRDIASAALNNMELKKGFAAINIAKANSDEAYFGSLKATAQKTIIEAEEKITKAESSPNAKSGVDEIEGAKDLVVTAKSQFEDAQYIEAINTANEAKRLSGIVVAMTPAPGSADVKVQNADSQKSKKDYIIYRVKLFKNPPKDHLRKISKKFYNDEMKWKKIYKANKDKIQNPDLIKPGWKLKIPINKK